MLRRLALVLAPLLAVGAIVAVLTRRPDTAMRVATGLVSHVLCSETFVAGRWPPSPGVAPCPILISTR